MCNCFPAKERQRRAAAASFCLLIAANCFIPTLSAADPEERTLRGIDLKGELHWLGESPQCQGIVVVFLAIDCPISNRCLPALNEIAGKPRSKPTICVYGVVSSPHVTREEALAHSEKYNPQFPILFDASSELRTQLVPTHTPHAFLLSPQGKTLYDGAIDDRFAAINKAKLTATKYFLKDAIQSLLKREKIAVAKTTPVGCPLEVAAKPAADARITFNRDIAPILYSQCGSCHRPGEVGPFPLLTYQDAIKHARQIEYTTAERIMPPWKPATEHGKFLEERTLSDRQIELVAEWVGAGMPEGSAADKPALPDFPTGWQLGEPDLILKPSQDFVVEAAGDDVHQHFVLASKLTRDRLVAAIEFRPGNPAVVHHASFYLDVTGAAAQARRGRSRRRLRRRTGSAIRQLRQAAKLAAGYPPTTPPRRPRPTPPQRVRRRDGNSLSADGNAGDRPVERWHPFRLIPKPPRRR